MKPKYVFDACALIVYLRHEKGADHVHNILLTPAEYLVHTLNLCEVFYDFLRIENRHIAQMAINKLQSHGFEFHSNMDIWTDASEIKAVYRKVSLADCFALALAKFEDAVLVTSDHHEFDQLVDKGICMIHFFR